MNYKKILFLAIIILMTRNFATAQNVTRYFLLDSSQQKNLRFNHIKCADDMYKAELFNVFYGADTTCFTLFTALPDYRTKQPEWKEVSLDSIKSKLIPVDSLRKQLGKAHRKYIINRGNIDKGAELKSEYRKPIVKIGNKYFSPSSPTIMEHFILVKYDKPSNYIHNIFPNLNQFFEINTDAPIFPLAKFEDIYLKKFKKPSFNSGGESARYNEHYLYNLPILLRNENAQIMGKRAYMYWTLASWMIDGRGEERGIDRFAYIPKIGIVSGAFTYYFYSRSRYFDERLKKGYLEDIQMMPYEINGKPVAK